MAWRLIGEVTLDAATFEKTVGWVELPPQGGIEVRVIQTSPADQSPYYNGLMWFETGTGRSLGTRKFWGHAEGEDYLVGDGLTTGSGRGLLKVSPRRINRKNFLAGGRTWGLRFLADEPSTLPQDRYEAPGFVNAADRLLQLIRIGTQARIRF